MNDDTVPDVGMTIGSDGEETPSHCSRRSQLSAFALSAFCARAEVYLVSGVFRWRRSMCETECAAVGRLHAGVCQAI